MYVAGEAEIDTLQGKLEALYRHVHPRECHFLYMCEPGS